MRRAVSIWLPTWSTDRLRRQSHAALSPDQPLITAVVEGNRRLVAGVDRAARSAGIRPGQTVTQAKMLVPDVAIAPAQPAEDAAGLERLAGWALRACSPIVAPAAPDGLWLDLAGMDHFGPEPVLVDQLLDRLAGAGIAARAGVADTAGAAHAVARYGDGRRSIVPPGEHRAALAEFPIAALRLPSEILSALQRLGIDTIEELEQLPRAPLTRRFGDAACCRLDQALGRRPEPISPLVPADLIQRRRAFVDPIGTAAQLQRAIQQLVTELVAQLQARDIGARIVDLVYQRVDGLAQASRIGTSKPSRDGRRLGRLLVDRLEYIDPGFGIEAMIISVPLAEPLPAAQFGSVLAADEPAVELAALVDALGNRLGPSRLYRLALVPSDVPERAVRAIPPLSAPSAETWPAAWPRPGRLLDPPEEIQVIAELPDQPPAQFSWRGIRRRVHRADGPERITGEWWRRDRELAAVRDYWQVEDEHGDRFWLYRSGDGQHADTGSLRWFVHGLFG